MPSLSRRWSAPRLVARTERLVVRPLEASDFGAWLEANRRRGPKVTPYEAPMREAHELTPAFFRRMVRSHRRLALLDRSYILGLFRRRGGALVGTISVLIAVRAHTQVGWIGYSIYNHEQHKGYGSEGVRAVVGLALSKLRLHRLEAGIEPANRASIKLAKAVGLRREARLSSATFQRGRWVDLHIYATTATWWGLPDPPPRVRTSLLD